MAKELLITASIGLYKNRAGKYYLQCITAEEYNNYIFPISAGDAKLLSKDDKLSIEPLPEHFDPEYAPVTSMPSH